MRRHDALARRNETQGSGPWAVTVSLAGEGKRAMSWWCLSRRSSADVIPGEASFGDRRYGRLKSLAVVGSVRCEKLAREDAAELTIGECAEA